MLVPKAYRFLTKKEAMVSLTHGACISKLSVAALLYSQFVSMLVAPWCGAPDKHAVNLLG